MCRTMVDEELCQGQQHAMVAIFIWELIEQLSYSLEDRVSIATMETAQQVQQWYSFIQTLERERESKGGREGEGTREEMNKSIGIAF